MTQELATAKLLRGEFPALFWDLNYPLSFYQKIKQMPNLYFIWCLHWLDPGFLAALCCVSYI